jgi:hypothetical protein
MMSFMTSPIAAETVRAFAALAEVVYDGTSDVAEIAAD